MTLASTLFDDLNFGCLCFVSNLLLNLRCVLRILTVFQYFLIIGTVALFTFCSNIYVGLIKLEIVFITKYFSVFTNFDKRFTLLVILVMHSWSVRLITATVITRIFGSGSHSFMVVTCFTDMIIANR